MLDTPEAVFEALRENHERPHGLARTVTAEELVDAAEVLDKPDLLVTALLELMTAYEYTGEHRKSPVAFARILKLWDTTPTSFSDHEARQVFWRFKWVTTSLLQVPEVPLASIGGWIDEMRKRYEAAGHDLQPVAAMRHQLAGHSGIGLADAYDLWATRSRSEFSDCVACETRQRAWHHLASGDDAAALAVWRPVLVGEQGCDEEPQTSQARALLPLLRSGRADEARSHHLTGYRKVRGRTGGQAEVGYHLEFCAHSRNEGRGLEILAENRPLFEAKGAPLDHLDFLTGTEVLLSRLVEAGHEGIAVAGPPGRSWTVAGLLAWVGGEADSLAVAFDTRNGTSHVGDRRRSRLALAPLLGEPLPLGLRAATVRAVTPPEGPPATPNPATGATRIDIPEDFVALVREARRLTRDGHPSAQKLWTRVAERFGDVTESYEDVLGPGDLLAAELAEHRAFELWFKDLHARGSAELETAARHFDRLSMPWHALSARARARAWVAAPSEGESDGSAPDHAAIRDALDSMAREADELLVETPFDGEPLGEGEAAYGADLHAERVLAYLSLRYSVAYAAHLELHEALADAEEHQEDPDRVEEAHGIGVDALTERFTSSVDALHTEASRLGHPHQAATARQFRADLLARRGDLAEAERELRAALEEIESAGRHWRRPRPSVHLAQILMAQDRPEEATDLLRSVIADVVAHDDPTLPLGPVHLMLAHAAVHLDDVHGAVRHLSEAAVRFDRAEAPTSAVQARLELADVLNRSGRQADAVAVLENALADAPPGVDARMLAQGRLTLGRGLRDLEEYLPAAEELVRLADTVGGWPEEEREGVLTMVAAEAAVTLALAERWEAADTAYERAVAAHAESPNLPHIALMMREFARLTLRTRDDEDVDAALEHLARADAVLDARNSGEEGFALCHERGENHLRRAMVLAGASRFDEALPEAESAIAAHEQGGEHGELARAEAVRITALIEGNGLERTAEAITRLTEAADRCREAGHPEAAQVLDTLRQDFRAR
ncbi:hypothetical protein [Streptomyces sp. NPDC056144]|uniref:hypothetical protein n=1 Tax=unclassified Streptomyces TaxID=2593676 RepID=UPI0035DD1C37